jgi:hypothetical protein
MIALLFTLQLNVINTKEITIVKMDKNSSIYLNVSAHKDN